ncbi:MAG: glycosyl hydrolase, partial [Bacteroidia bacterium]
MIKYLMVVTVLMAAACSPKKTNSNQTETVIEKNTETVKTAEFDAEGKTVVLYNTSANLLNKLEKSTISGFTNAPQAREDEISVFINPEKQFQTHVGIGGAITDASAEVFAKLSEANQKELIKAYFDKNEGLGYNIIRTSIHSCDFSSGSFTYVKEGDESLETFNIDHDREFRLPMIKKALELIGDDLMF